MPALLFTLFTLFHPTHTPLYYPHTHARAIYKTRTHTY